MVPVAASMDSKQVDGLSIREKNCIMEELKAHGSRLKQKDADKSGNYSDQSNHISMLLMVFRFFL